MRHVRILALLVFTTLVCVSAFGQIIDPNIAFCNVPASSACGGDPNLVTSSTQFGMFPIGGNSNTGTWFLLVSIPEMTQGSATAPTITSPSFPSITLVAGSPKFLTPAPPVVDIYSLVSSLTGGLQGDNSMSNANMFNFAVPGVKDFAVFVYSITTAFTGNTAYVFNVGGSGLPDGTFLAGVAVGGPHGNVQFSTPFTTSGDVVSAFPDSGMTLMLLGGALFGLETLRRRLRG